MKKNTTDDTIKGIHEYQKEKTKKAFAESAPVLVIKGIWLFAEGTSLMLTSLFTIYQAHYGNYPVWGKYGMTVAGVLVLVPAALLLAKFFRSAAKA